MKFGYSSLMLILLLPLFFSCANTRESIYFDIKKDSTTLIQYQNTSPLIQKNDLLSITVSSLSQEASLVYNVSNNVSGTGSGAVLGGYLVNSEGNIQFPVIGSIKAEGFTKEELQVNITRKLIEQKLLLNPIVSIRNLNFKVTVLGEVGKPTVINVPTEKINLLEAIGFAGDLTLYSSRSDVMVLREENGARTFKIIDLTKNDVFSSPYFYLKPNDVVYVKPNKTKISSVSNTRLWLPTIFSALTLLSVLFYRVSR
ncbi:polysaccharide biosynthesis/export family protein [Chitinophagaceae bacterium LB-8]|uniref:Polysaccharide biosynthesis/export family protein n=1 Tax=Paraflavisolibacter caeni TaxID=2982496 RepID=A0A9X2XSS7_9BACT|nr:polysaccharide biosynthesis/export family protein [Paraflavisolibacter caeni]MCU7548261.1 polysaccharide biosynthesis/export family protein [Paraflavisolibacter caeni]